MDIPDVNSPLRKLVQKQNEYIACLLEAKQVHRKTAVAACALCFLLGIFAGMFLVDQHYKKAIGNLELELVPSQESPEAERQAPEAASI
jgi:hypothetical protein